MSFQITILKVLAGHPDGRASVTELTRYVSVLMSSGSDWTDRMRRFAARAPKLEIFADAFVLRDDLGWCITDGGRQFLASLEAPTPRPRRRAGATVRTLRDGRHRTEPGPADTSTGCRQHAHLAAGSRSGRNAAICVIGIAIGYYKWAAKAVRELAAHLRRLSRTRWSLRRRYLGRRVCGPSSRSTVCAAAGA